MQDRRLRGHEHTHEQQWNLALMMQKCLFLQYWLMDQTCSKKGLKTEKLINWKTYFFNILTWKQTGINIYIYTTQSDGGKSYVSSPLLTESSELFTESWNYSNFDQFPWVVLRIFPYSIPTNTSTILCYGNYQLQPLLYWKVHFTSKINGKQKNLIFAKEQCTVEIHSQGTFVTMALVTLSKLRSWNSLRSTRL